MTQLDPYGDPSYPTAAEPDASRRARAGHVASVADERDASPRTGATRRVCAWCDGPIPPTARRDAVCCTVRCRQARHRFNRAVGNAGPVAGGRALRLAYADPPYPGNAWLYRRHPDYAGEVNHAALIGRLVLEYDGWALSTSASALPAVLALCPRGVRVAAWHRGERPTASRWPLNAWEPVIYHGGRPADPARSNLGSRRTDSLVYGVSPLTTLPGRVTGTKPAAFCAWVFALLGAAPGDTFDDLYPGSGAVTRAWTAYTAPDPSRTPTVHATGRVASLADEHDTSHGPALDASPPADHDAYAVALDDASRPTPDTTEAAR